MSFQKRPVSFMLISTEHGPLITTRLDLAPDFSNQLYDRGYFEPLEISCALELLQLRRKHYGDGVVAIDCGACFGIHTIEWSKLMTDWGYVVSIEAQERLYYAVAGNIALNNCMNVRAINAAVGNIDGTIRIPKADFSKPGRYGSIELKERPGKTEVVGQPISYSESDLVPVPALRLDSLKVGRVDLIKLDVEGMELEALQGARSVLEQHKPMLIVEIIKSDRNALFSHLAALGYTIRPLGRLDVLAVHRQDKCLPAIAQRHWSKEVA